MIYQKNIMQGHRSQGQVPNAPPTFFGKNLEKAETESWKPKIINQLRSKKVYVELSDHFFAFESFAPLLSCPLLKLTSSHFLVFS